MFDLDFSKLAVIGVVALVVIGPEKLPRVARTLGALIGKAQRYVSDVKAEVGRQMDLEELKKMKEQMAQTARDMESSMRTQVANLEQEWHAGAGMTLNDGLYSSDTEASLTIPPQYKHPKKKWRVKQSATPHWFKARSGVRRQVLSGAARVARYRPKLK